MGEKTYVAQGANSRKRGALRTKRRRSKMTGCGGENKARP